MRKSSRNNNVFIYVFCVADLVSEKWLISWIIYGLTTKNIVLLNCLILKIFNQKISNLVVDFVQYKWQCKSSSYQVSSRFEALCVERLFLNKVWRTFCKVLISTPPPKTRQVPKKFLVYISINFQWKFSILNYLHEPAL